MSARHEQAGGMLARGRLYERRRRVDVVDSCLPKHCQQRRIGRWPTGARFGNRACVRQEDDDGSSAAAFHLSSELAKNCFLNAECFSVGVEDAAAQQPVVPEKMLTQANGDIRSEPDGARPVEEWILIYLGCVPRIMATELTDSRRLFAQAFVGGCGRQRRRKQPESAVRTEHKTWFRERP